MGWMSDKQAEAADRLRAVIAPNVPTGETLVGCVHATRRSTFSAKLYALGVTDRHLLIQEVDRKWQPAGAPVVVAPQEVAVGNIFGEGATLSLGSKDQEIRFTAAGQDYKLMVLGGTLMENALAGTDQVDGLQALVAFLRSARRG